MATRRRFIDLSVPTEPGPSDPLKLTLRHSNHAETAPALLQIFGCATSDLPDGQGWAVDELELSSHAGTHVDAPWHYFPMSEGKPARTIDQLPLEWFFGPGVRLDFRAKARGDLITTADLQAELSRIAYTLQPGDIVLLNTGADKLWGTREYFDAGCGLDRTSTIWLCDQGIRVIGIDAWTLDRPFWAIREEFQRTADPAVIWSAHRAGIDREYCQIEKLANLDQLPRPIGFQVACFPVKITAGSAGWARVVALVEEPD
jgi:kynurenine formamidase